MNTVADTTRQRTRETAVSGGDHERARSLRASTRRLTAWWSGDPMSASFRAAREHDQRLQQRLGR
jgi:hypothetical protein